MALEALALANAGITDAAVSARNIFFVVGILVSKPLVGDGNGKVIESSVVLRVWLLTALFASQVGVDDSCHKSVLLASRGGISEAHSHGEVRHRGTHLDRRNCRVREGLKSCLSVQSVLVLDFVECNRASFVHAAEVVFESQSVEERSTAGILLGVPCAGRIGESNHLNIVVRVSCASGQHVVAVRADAV